MSVPVPAPAPVQAPTAATLRARLAARLQRSWVQRDWLAFALLDISWAYRGLVALRRFLYARGGVKSYRVPVPVIVVGNVVAGGAGKTPVVIEIVRYLKAQGWQPGVVSRGYGRVVERGNTWVALEVRANTAVSAAGDEPMLIQQTTGAPVFVARRRRDAARALLKVHPGVNVIVCDDGLQHLALQRDIEVCSSDLGKAERNDIFHPRAFALAAGETRRIDFAVPLSELGWWDEAAHGWQIEPGVHHVYIGGDSAAAEACTAQFTLA